MQKDTGEQIYEKKDEDSLRDGSSVVVAANSGAGC